MLPQANIMGRVSNSFCFLCCAWMETHADIVLRLLLYTLPSVPSETADPSACIVSITSLRHFGRQKCLHVFVNKLRCGCLSPNSSRVMIGICSNVSHLLQRSVTEMPRPPLAGVSVGSRASSLLWIHVPQLQTSTTKCRQTPMKCVQPPAALFTVHIVLTVAFTSTG